MNNTALHIRREVYGGCCGYKRAPIQVTSEEDSNATLSGAVCTVRLRSNVLGCHLDANPQFAFLFYSDQTKRVNGTCGFLTAPKSSHPGVTIVSPGTGYPVPTGTSTAIADGYQVMTGIDGDSCTYAQGKDANGNPNTKTWAGIQSDIATMYAAGIRWIYIDEIQPAPGQSNASTPTSIAWNVAGCNIIYNWMHAKYLGLKFGISMGNTRGNSAALHLLMLKAGLHEDFASAEYYNADTITTTGFTNQKALYPNVLTMLMIYGTQTICQENNANNTLGTAPWTPVNGVDIWAFWDMDGSNISSNGWIGPLVDYSMLPNAETMAATGSMNSFCQLPQSWVWPGAWTWSAKATNFTVLIQDFQNWNDNTLNPNRNTTNAVASCDYKVKSGSGAGKGSNDPSLVVTKPWTSRLCNANLTITVGTTAMCNVIGTSTCQVWTRAHTAGGQIDNLTYQVYSIDY